MVFILDWYGIGESWLENAIFALNHSNTHNLWKWVRGKFPPICDYERLGIEWQFLSINYLCSDTEQNREKVNNGLMELWKGAETLELIKNFNNAERNFQI